MFKIRCEVSGGVTGYRCGFMKDEHGKVQTFATAAEAEVVAAQAREAVKGNTRATFNYTVAEDWEGGEA